MEISDDPLVLREMERYGLGTQRTLASFQALTGINFKARTIGGKTTAELEALQPPDKKRKHTADIFTGLWRNNGWGDPESRSGAGSTVSATRTLRLHLAELCTFLGIRQIVDAGCGDFNWMALISERFDLYVGLDVVPDMIAELDKRFGGRRGHFFAVRDTAQDPLPRADAILCRDVMTHLSDELVLALLERVKESGARYLLATSYVSEQNRNIPTGDWRPLDLTKAPFDLPQPFLSIDERGDGSKLLGVWRIKDLGGE